MKFAELKIAQPASRMQDDKRDEWKDGTMRANSTPLSGVLKKHPHSWLVKKIERQSDRPREVVLSGTEGVCV